MEIITGYKGAAHVTAAQDGATNAAIFGAGQYILNVSNKMAATKTDNNTVAIADGFGINQGRYFATAGENVTIETGTANAKREDLIVARYEKAASGVETIALKVIKGTAGESYTTPSHTTGDIIAGASVDEMVLYKVHVNNAEIEEIIQVPSISNINNLESIMNTLYKNYLGYYEWDSTRTYYKGDIVTYKGARWSCASTNKGSEPDNSMYWGITTLRNDLNTLNTGTARGDVYSSGRTYNEGDMFIYNGKIYWVRQSCQDKTPPNASYYDEFTLSSLLRTFAENIADKANQDDVDTLNNSLSKLEKFQTSGQIDITSQMPYTFLSDGYVWLNADGTGKYAYVSITSNAGVRIGIVGASATSVTHASAFVKKGTKVGAYSMGGGATVYFTPLDR